MLAWFAYSLFTISFGTAVFLKGGVYPQQWEWLALGISVATLLAHMPKPERSDLRIDVGIVLLIVISTWFLFQLIPLPANWVKAMTPLRWQAADTSWRLTGIPQRSWVVLSVAPSAGLERLLNVLPAIAAFIMARRLSHRWPRKIWILTAPIVTFALFESILGILQFYFARASKGGHIASGTYVYHNHFAGLLELAFPVAAWGAIATWRNGASRHCDTTGVALQTSALLAIAACLFMGIVTSLSRMGFSSMVVGLVLTIAVAGLAQGARVRRWLWVTPIPVALFILLILPPKELIERFQNLADEQDLAQDARVQIWRDARRVIAAYPWTGVGLGAYEHGQYRFKTAMPIYSVDFAHNDYLQVIAELGAFGAVLFGALAIWTLGRVLIAVLKTRDRPDWEIGMGLLGAMLTLAFHSLADFNLYLPANAVALAWLAGTSVGWARREPKPGHQGFRWFRPAAVGISLASASLLFAAFSIATDFLKPASEGWLCAHGGCRYDQIFGSIDSEGMNAANLAALTAQDPANPFVWCAYGEVLAGAGDIRKARGAFEHAISLAPRIPPVRMRAANFYFTHGLADSGVQNTREILEQTSAFDGVLFSYLQALRIPTETILGTGLPPAPRAANSWLEWELTNGSNGAIVLTWDWMRLNHLDSRQGAADAAWALWRRKAFREARDLWADWAGQEGGDFHSQFLTNREFRDAPAGGPFDWTLDANSSVKVERKNGLTVRFSGSENIAFAGVSQSTVVEGGRYRFSAEVETNGLTTDQGPFFSISDAARPQAFQAATQALLGTSPRSWINLDFSTPPGTTALDIRIERIPSQHFDSKISGTLHVYKVSLTPAQGVR